MLSLETYRGEFVDKRGTNGTPNLCAGISSEEQFCNLGKENPKIIRATKELKYDSAGEVWESKWNYTYSLRVKMRPEPNQISIDWIVNFITFQSFHRKRKGTDPEYWFSHDWEEQFCNLGKENPEIIRATKEFKYDSAGEECEIKWNYSYSLRVKMRPETNKISIDWVDNLINFQPFHRKSNGTDPEDWFSYN